MPAASSTSTALRSEAVLLERPRVDRVTTGRDSKIDAVEAAKSLDSIEAEEDGRSIMAKMFSQA